MSRSRKKIPIVKGSRHRNSLKSIKKFSRRKIRRTLNCNDEYLLQGKMSYKGRTLGIWKFLLKEYRFDFRFYEKDLNVVYTPKDHRFSSRKDFDNHKKWLIRSRRHCYGK